MTWHSTVESALGLTHPTQVTETVCRVVGRRFHAVCETCGPVSHQFGHYDRRVAETVATRHEARFAVPPADPVRERHA